MLVRALSPCRGDKASPRRGLNIPATTGTRKGAEADSQHKTALLDIVAPDVWCLSFVRREWK